MTQTSDDAQDAMLHDAAAVRKIANRLKRAQGQLAAVIAAVEAGGDCRDVVIQLSAVSSAIDRAGFAIISTALRECITVDAEGESQTDGEKPKLTVDELEKLFLSFA